MVVVRCSSVAENEYKLPELTLAATNQVGTIYHPLFDGDEAGRHHEFNNLTKEKRSRLVSFLDADPWNHTACQDTHEREETM